MFKHILVPVDGSKTSMLAVSKAAGLAKTFGSAVTAVYVIDPYPLTGVGADFAYGQAQYISAATAEANAALDATKKAMADAGVQVTTVVGEGHAVHDGILRALESDDISAEEALQQLLKNKRPTPTRLAVIFRSLEPGADEAEFAAFLRRQHLSSAPAA